MYRAMIFLSDRHLSRTGVTPESALFSLETELKLSPGTLTYRPSDGTIYNWSRENNNPHTAIGVVFPIERVVIRCDCKDGPRASDFC